MAFTYVTVTHTFETADDVAAQGSVEFTPVEPMTNDLTVIKAPVSGALSGVGGLSLRIAANTDPGTYPAGTTYKVVEKITGQPASTYYVQVPHNQGPILDLGTLSGWVAGGSGVAGVASVNGQTGVVTLAAGDIGAQLADGDLTGLAGLADGVPVRTSGTWGLVSGTPDGTKFLRDDGTWQPPSVASYTSENARDDIAAALVAGSNVTLTVDDPGNTIRIDAATSGSSGIPASTVTTKGDLIAATGSAAVAPRSVGTNGQALLADSAQTTGLAWGAPAPAAHSHAATDLTSGTVATARLGSGSASSSTFLRGDQTWATPVGGGGSGNSLTVFNVKTDYGAAGNGSTNDTTAINNAISACSAAGGGIVYFPAGTYMTDGGHSIPAYVNIRGCESSPQYWVYNGSSSPTSGCALKIRSGTAQTTMFTTSSSSKAFSIRDITLLGNNIGTTIQGIAPAAPSAEQNSTIENVAVIGFSSHGIGGSWQAARFSTIFVGGNKGYGLNCSGSAQWADIMLDHSFITGNKLGALNIDSTGSNGLLNFTDSRFERSGWDPNNITTPTNTGSPGIRIRGNAKKLSFVGCSTDANSGSGLDIDRTSGRELFNLSFSDCYFCRDGFGSMSALGEYAGVKVKGSSGNTVDFVSFANCFTEYGLADDGGTQPAYTHPKYGLWLEYTSYIAWAGGRLDANSTAIYGGTGGWATNFKPVLSIPQQNVLTMPYWSDNASRPSPVTDGALGINGSLGSGAGKIEFYWGGWHTVTST